MDSSSNTIYDVDLFGTIDSTGKISQYYGKEAVQNSIKLWLTSFKNDILRNPNKGGYLTNYLYKPMSDNNRQNIEDAIVDGFNQDYTPTAYLKYLKVTPDYENKTWIIDLIVYVPIIKSDVPITANINNLI